MLTYPTYSLAEAARLLQISSSKLRWWLEGSVRGPRRYPPVLRAQPTGASEVTWGEFIEAALLREYRKHLPLQRLRPLRRKLSSELGTPFPFATARPLVSGRELVWNMQQQLGIPEELWIVVDSGQLVLGSAAESFYQRVTFDADSNEAMAFIVMSADEPVCVNPLLSFGIPTVRGVRAEVVAELSLAGEPASVIVDIYRDHGLTPQDVKTAVEFQTLFLEAA